MPSVDLVVESPISSTVRARQLRSIFDVPDVGKCRIDYKGDFPLDERPWNVGLIVGPSGCGKSTILNHVFGGAPEMLWGRDGVIDDFRAGLSIEEISSCCQAVGFNTIPAWLRPYSVLSNGEKFRVELARRLLETDDLIVMDEFTSVVDRQVAQYGSHAVQKYVRKHQKKFVAASCHFDIIDWLNPDWVFEPSIMKFSWRELRRRPQIDCQIRRVHHSAWKMFAPYHYLTASLNKAAKCFCLFVQDRPAVFAGVLHRPHAKVKDIAGVSRVVTLPDFQGLGLAFVLMDALGGLFKAVGKRLHMYPAHPPFVRAMCRSSQWALIKRPGRFSPKPGNVDGLGGRPCAVFRYTGQISDRSIAIEMLA